MSDLLTDQWFPGDVIVDRPTGKIVGQYAGPPAPRLFVKMAITESTIMFVQSGVTIGAVAVDPRKIRHLRATDFKESIDELRTLRGY